MFTLCWCLFCLNAVMSTFGETFSNLIYFFVFKKKPVLLTGIHSFLFFFICFSFVHFHRHFSNWVYHGMIEDPGQELFIEFINYYKPMTKSFFDKAFIIKSSSVPGFLSGWEQSILLCGKYSNLLKVYNPMVSLFYFSHFTT